MLGWRRWQVLSEHRNRMSPVCWVRCGVDPMVAQYWPPSRTLSQHLSSADRVMLGTHGGGL